MKEKEAKRRQQRRAEQIQCPMHSYATHGKEAEELRRGIQNIIDNHKIDDGELGWSDHAQEILESLNDLLDEVDCRDSLAYLERMEIKRRKAG